VSDEKEAIAIVHEAIDAGINFFDNAWEYHDGRSEEILGRALPGGWRDKAFLMTKVCTHGRKADVAMTQLRVLVPRETDEARLALRLGFLKRLDDAVRLEMKLRVVVVDALVDLPQVEVVGPQAPQRLLKHLQGVEGEPVRQHLQVYGRLLSVPAVFVAGIDVDRGRCRLGVAGDDVDGHRGGLRLGAAGVGAGIKGARTVFSRVHQAT
jgi:hypothetical protein